MKRPAFQFYPGDWQRNANLRRCSPAARGVWVDIMCLLHDSDEYGVLRWPVKEIAQACGASMSHVKELIEKSVLKGSDKSLEAPYIYTPRSGRKDGTPVTLLRPQAGPIWYSSRMVKDEYVRTIRGESSRFGEAPNDAPKPPFGDGSTTTSTTAVIGTPPVVAKEQNQGTHTERAPEPAKAAATARGKIAMAIRATGMTDLNTSHPKFMALIDQGVTVEEFQGAARDAVAKSKGFAYMLAMVEGRRKEAANLGQLPAGKPDPMADPDSRQRIEADGIALGLGPWVAFDSDTGKTTPWPAYAARVKAKRGDKATGKVAGNVAEFVARGLSSMGA